MKFIHTIVKSSSKYLRQSKLSTLLIVPTLFVALFISVLAIRYHATTVASHAELSYLEHSPRGPKGGSVMPASCDSVAPADWAHSTCACTPGQTTTASCAVTGGTGTVTATCVNSAGSYVWQSSACTEPITCNAGYTLVNDYYGTYCKVSCYGNYIMTNVMTLRQTGCSQWCSSAGCSLNSRDPVSKFADLISIEKAAALAMVCVDPIYESVPLATCTACPSGTTANSSHTACAAPSVPSVNINLGN